MDADARRKVDETEAAPEANPAHGRANYTRATESGTAPATEPGTLGTASAPARESGGLLAAGIGVGYHRELVSAQCAANSHR